MHQRGSEGAVPGSCAPNPLRLTREGLYGKMELAYRVMRVVRLAARVRGRKPKLSTSLAAVAIAFALTGLMVLTQDAAAGAAEGLRDRPQLTGNWGGARTRLADLGIDPYASYTAGFWSNLRGGFATGVRYEGFAQWGVDANLETLAGWRGARFHIGWNSYHGGQPSTELVGQFSMAFIYGSEAEVSVRFYDIYVEQELLGGRVQLKVGQLAADDDFFVSRYSDALLNGTFGGFGLGREEQIAPFYPLAAPGAYVLVRPAEQWFARVGVYTADPGEDVTSNIGFDWSFDEGASFLAEVGTQQSPFGYPGSYTLGAFGTTTTGSDFERGGTVDGAYGLFGMIDQALAVDLEGAPTLGAFVRGQFGAQEDRSIVRWYVDGGLKLFGPLPGRDADVLSLGVGFDKFGRDYVSRQRSEGENVSEYQLSVEFTYRAQVTGWLTLQPDLQLFFDPHFSRRDAIVFGLQAVVEL